MPRVGHNLQVIAPDAFPLETRAFPTVRFGFIAFDFALPTRQTACWESAHVKRQIRLARM
jgi:hypothetical protein